MLLAGLLVIPGNLGLVNPVLAQSEAQTREDKRQEELRQKRREEWQEREQEQKQYQNSGQRQKDAIKYQHLVPQGL
jgi:hypothetical protein